MSALRRIKSPDEVERLRAAAAAADSVMGAVMDERLSGRTEGEVSRHIRELLLEAGHDTAGFAIVASGPNSASPHHEAGDRVIGRGDALVLDIGGSLGGYCSDTSRTAFVGEPGPSSRRCMPSFARRNPRPARRCNRACRREIDAGHAESSTRRATGRPSSIEPATASAWRRTRSPTSSLRTRSRSRKGMPSASSPGSTSKDRWGARIEDIVVCTDAGGERLNTLSTELYVVD